RSRFYGATNGLAELPTGWSLWRSSRSGGLLGLSDRWSRRPLPICSTWNNQLQQAPDILLVVKLNDYAPALALRLYLHFRPHRLGQPLLKIQPDGSPRRPARRGHPPPGRLVGARRQAAYQLFGLPHRQL